MLVRFSPPPLSRVSLGAGMLAVVLCLSSVAPALGQTGSEECRPSATDLCLLDGRFRVSVEWWDDHANEFRLPDTPDSGLGTAVELPGDDVSDSGYFWFFEPDDIDLVVKMVDGGEVNGFFWTFYGSTSNVEYWITVTDTSDGTSVQYRKPQGEFGVGADFEAFDDSPSGGERVGTASELTPRAVFRPRNGLPSCDAPQVVCVQDGRIAIESTAPDPMDPDAPPVRGLPLETTPTSAVFYHVQPQSPEAVVKVIDPRPVDDRFWIFTSVFGPPGAEITVTDLDTGTARLFRADQDGLLATGDRKGFVPEPPAGAWLETPELPGFRFKVRVTAGGGEIPTRQEADCLPETLCISGAVPGRSELFMRIVGPKPNGFLQPNLVKFSTSQIEAWVEQLSSGQLNYYELDPVTPGSSDLTGFFDRTGFEP